MEQTIRQQIIMELEGGPLSAKDISALVSIPEKEVFAHLEHIRRTLSREGRKLLVIPSQCRDCGFVFHSRTRMSKPGRCPKCQGSYINEPLFMVKGGR